MHVPPTSSDMYQCLLHCFASACAVFTCFRVAPRGHLNTRQSFIFTEHRSLVCDEKTAWYSLLVNAIFLVHELTSPHPRPHVELHAAPVSSEAYQKLVRRLASACDFVFALVGFPGGISLPQQLCTLRTALACEQRNTYTA